MKPIPFLFVCLLAATGVSAQILDDNALPGFDRLDADSDGLVTRDEANRASQSVFAKLDGNGDGVISTNEVIARQQMIQLRSEHRQSRLALTAARLDADADGMITVEEFAALPDFFALIDQNGDDMISAEEASRMRDRLFVLWQ